MTTEVLNDHHEHHDHHQEIASKVTFGFWIYILTDCIMFASLFATYSVLHNNTYGSISIHDIVCLPYTLVQTLILLVSTLTNGFMFSNILKRRPGHTMFWLGVTFILGILFFAMGMHEFIDLIHKGYNWQGSAFLSSFFVLSATLYIHIIVGLLWMIILMIQLSMKNVTHTMKTRFTCFGLFWNYLNIIWVIIFTIVYLMGAI